MIKEHDGRAWKHATAALACGALMLAAGCELPAVAPPSTDLARTEGLPAPVERDFAAIQASDTLRALIASNSTSYFIYRGEPMGYEYDLLSRFASDHDLELVVMVVDSPKAVFRELNRGVGDVVAARIIPLPGDTPAVAITRPLYATGAAMVTGAPDTAAAGAAPGGDGDEGRLMRRMGSRTLAPDSVRLRARLLRSPSERRADTAYVPLGSEYYGRLVELVDSTGTPLEVVELAESPSYEDLIARVAAGTLRLVVTPENLARLGKEAFTDLVVTPSVGPEDSVAWAVRSNAPELLATLNAWLADPANERFLADRYFAYFVDRKAYAARRSSEFLTSETGVISRYDSLFMRHADRIGWDWRLLAAQTAQESRFDPRARSWAGARGLLQLMPRTAREMGVRDPTDPDQNVAGAVRYLEWLDRAWRDEVPDPEERRKFVLASYNAGRGHVQDAQRLARKYGDDPLRWDDVAFWLLQKSTKEYSRDPVVRFGYVRGTEPVNYVSRILERYRAYESSGIFRSDAGPPDSARVRTGPLFRDRSRPERDSAGPPLSRPSP